MVVNLGYKNTEEGVFPEDWDIIKMGKIATITMGQSPLSEFYNTELVGLPLIQGNADIENRKTIIRSYTSMITKKGKVGDIIMSVRAPVGEVAKSTFDCCLGRGVCAISYKNEYLYHYLVHFEKSWCKFSSGSTFDSVNSKQVLELNVPIPKSESEQITIASALSDADNLIDKLEKLIEKKKNIKQGAMQQLLKPKKGWVIKKVQDIAQIGRGRVISHKEIASSLENTFPVYSSQTTNNGIMGYIGSYDFDGEYITWTTDGENAGTVFYRNGKFNCTNVCGTIKLKSENARFIAYLLNSITSFYVSRNLANPKLMNDVMKKIEISIPEIKEQERISNIIFDLELELNTLINQLIKYKNIKQGMMQNLLTGKIRLV